MPIALDSFGLFVTVVIAPKSEPSLAEISNRRCNLGARHVNSPISNHWSPSAFGPWSYGSSCDHNLALVSKPINRRLSIRGFISMHNTPEPPIADLRYMMPSLPHTCHISPCEWWHMSPCECWHVSPFLAYCEPWNCWICLPRVTHTTMSWWRQAPHVTFQNQLLAATRPLSHRVIVFCVSLIGSSFLLPRVPFGGNRKGPSFFGFLHKPFVNFLSSILTL